MKTLIALLVFAVMANIVSDEETPNVKKILVEAVSDLETLEDTDLGLLERIIDLQLRIDDRQNALATYKFFASRLPPGGGGPGQPGMYEITQLLIKDREPHEFMSLIEFVESTEKELATNSTTIQIIGFDGTKKVKQHASGWIDAMKANMIARAANEQMFDLSETIFDSISGPIATTSPADRGVLGKNHKIEAAKQLNYQLVTNGHVADALSVAKRFGNPNARAQLAVAIYQNSKHAPDVQTQIDQFLAGTSTPSALAIWYREKLNVAIKNKDGNAAADLLAKLKATGNNTGYIATNVVKILNEQGDTQRASQLLAETTQEVESKPIDARTGLFTDRQLAKQYADAGDIDKVIELCSHWTVDMVKTAHQRRMTNYVQPISGLALKLAKEGDVEEAERVTGKIQDEFWQADTFADIAKLVARKDKEGGKPIYERAMKVAKRIEDATDRSYVFGKIIAGRINRDTTFDELLDELEIIDDKRLKAGLLSSAMESRAKKLPLEQIKEAIEIIADGDSMNLSEIVNSLIARKEFDLAAESVLKIKIEPEFEHILHNFMESISKKWDVDKQLQFVSNAMESEQANLLKIVLDNAPMENKQQVRKAALDNLAKHSFSEPLYKDLMKHYLAKEDFKSLGLLLEVPLDRNQYVEANVFQKSIGLRLAELCKQRLAEKGQDSLDKIEKSIKPSWAREAVYASQIAGLIEDSRFESALDIANSIAAPRQRAKMKFFIADKMANFEK